ncbi:MAG: hypothetical protein Q9220_007350 [cf. Caloplaca sp. 1 TL-2023]
MNLIHKPANQTELIRVFDDNPKVRDILDARGAPASHHVVECGNVGFLCYLGSECLFDEDGFYNTLMHKAIKHRQLDILKILPPGVAKAQNVFGMSPFDEAVELDDGWELQQYLLDNSPAVTHSVVEDMRDQRQDPDAEREQRLQGLWFDLLTAGLTPNARNPHGNTILSAACEQVPELILHADKPGIHWFRDLDGDSPLEVARRHGDPLYLQPGVEEAKDSEAIYVEHKGSPERWKFAVAATRIWRGQAKGCCRTAMNLLKAAWQVSEKPDVEEKSQPYIQAAIHWRRGRIYQLDGQPRKAVEVYNKGLELEVRNFKRQKLSVYIDTAMLEFVMMIELGFPLPNEVVDLIALRILEGY